MKPLRPDLQIKLNTLLAEIEAAGGLEAYYDQLFGAGQYEKEKAIFEGNDDYLKSFLLAWQSVDFHS